MVERSRNILFVINGLGFGNGRRCSKLIKELLGRGHRVDVICSGNSRKVVETLVPSNAILEMAQHQLPQSKGLLKFLNFFFWIFATAKLFLKNRSVVSQKMRSKKFDLIVCDSTYEPLFVQRTCPLVFLSHVKWTRAVMKGLSGPSKFFNFSYYIEWADDFLQNLFADSVIMPILNPDDFRSNESDALFVTTAFFEEFEQNFPRPTPPSEGKKVVFVSSGYICSFYEEIVSALVQADGCKVDVVGPKLPRFENRISFIQPSFDKPIRLSSYDVVITNAGYLTMTESLFSQRPYIFIPFPGHLEQITNGIYIEKNQFGMVSRPDTLVRDIERYISNFKEYKLNLEANKMSRNGLQETRQFLESRMEAGL